MNIYFVKNLETGRYLGDELEPAFEKAWFKDYEDARECAWARNVIYHKRLDSLDKWVVEVKRMRCPVMYVEYFNGCLRRFFDVREAIRFYEGENSAYEIGYESESGNKALDLTKDWMWTDKYVSCTRFDDDFWNSTFAGDFMETPGRNFNAYFNRTKSIFVQGNKVVFEDTSNVRSVLKQIIDGSPIVLRDENGIVLSVKQEIKYLHYDFGGSYTSVTASLWYPNGRLFGYVALSC